MVWVQGKEMTPALVEGLGLRAGVGGCGLLKKMIRSGVQAIIWVGGGCGCPEPWEVGVWGEAKNGGGPAGRVETSKGGYSRDNMNTILLQCLKKTIALSVSSSCELCIRAQW